MRLLVVGAGSTGGYFGGRLAQAGQDVTFLVRPARMAQLREHGLRLRSPLGDAVLHPALVTAEALAGTYDAILFTVKGYQLEAAMDDIAPAVGADTMILPVLNGMRHMPLLARRFSPGNLVGCALKVVTQLDEDGTIMQLTPMQDLAYGELDGASTHRIAMLDTFLHSADIGARLSPVIHREMWEKWVMLASLGAATCLLRGPVGAIEACPGGANLVLRLIDEIAAIVTAVGEAPGDACLKAIREQLTAKGSPMASSMYRDLLGGRDVEVETILGDLVRHSHDLGYDSPLLTAAYIHLRLYQNTLTAEGQGNALA